MSISSLPAFAALLVCVSAADYNYCKGYHGYNELYDLKRENKCMDVKIMMDLLHSINTLEGKPACRMHVIRILADHYGPNAQTPNFCHCDGKIDLQRYHTHVSDGTLDHMDSCLTDHDSYRLLFYRFFESPHSHSHHAGHCRTHDSIWYHLNKINSDGTDHDLCQKDFIMHLRYSLMHHSDHCTCKEVQTLSTRHTTHPRTQHSTQTESTTQSLTRHTMNPTMPSSTRHTTHSTTRPTTSLSKILTTKHVGHHHIPDFHCLGFESFRKLLHLDTENECLSANSVWHYLDDLQAKDSKCRESIQQQLAKKYKDPTVSSEMNKFCTCHERTHLVNHALHRLKNGTFGPCVHSNGTYLNIALEFFSIIRVHGCQNHHVLWPKLEGINNHCSFYNNGTCAMWTDCEQDLMIRAFLQYPTDDSDSCICSKVHATTSSRSTITSSTATSATISPTSSPATTTQRAAPKLSFVCNKIKVIESVAGSLTSTHVNSSKCVPGSSDDALVLSLCNITSPHTWSRGTNVMADCESSSQLVPTYTPIATFDGDFYYANGAQSGIFLGCSDNGIKIAIQKCNGVPEIIHIEQGAFQNNPRNYYKLLQMNKL